MPLEFTITWRELLVAVTLATLVYLLEYAIFSHRRKAPVGPVDQSTNSNEIDRLRRELAELRQRLERLEGALRDREAPEVAGPGDSYDAALRFARQGMEAAEIAARCGISRDEAALIVTLQQTRREAR